MRKYPSIPFLTRICTQEINLETTEIIVPKGTLILMPIFGLHRDPSIYPDPEKFDPERFNADEIAIRHSYTFLPFGEGPRNCIGLIFLLLNGRASCLSFLVKSSWGVTLTFIILYGVPQIPDVRVSLCGIRCRILRLAS
ncbi:hypothetical protein PUN28_009786 [Cardiocondyla obscurior]|uniref:Cytochrome P450 n=1 Tax=Cardiocondyla obscurior TaxID=286306 RepID=A0AAW2FNX7_9HYME